MRPVLAGSWYASGPFLAAVLVVLSVLSTGCTDPTGRGAPSVLDRSVSVDPGSFFEANLEMNESAQFTFEWSTDGTDVAFDVHSHASTQVDYHHRSNGSSGRGSFQAPSDGGYSLLWENPSKARVNLTFEVEGDFQIVSFAP